MERKIPRPKVDESGIVWICEKRVAEITGLSLQTLRNWRCKRKVFPYSKLNNKAVRYRLDEVLRIMEEKRIHFEY
jgi:predicted site-specific integrase-resolvase